MRDSFQGGKETSAPPGNDGSGYERACRLQIPPTPSQVVSADPAYTQIGSVVPVYNPPPNTPWRCVGAPIADGLFSIPGNPDGYLPHISSVRDDMRSTGCVCSSSNPIENAEPCQVVDGRIEKHAENNGKARTCCEILDAVGRRPASYPFDQAK